MKTLLTTIALTFFLSSAFAQLDKATCAEILKPYTKDNADFTKMHIATLDFTSHKQKFDIGWLKTFKYNFMEKVLDIEYGTDVGVFHIYIPYSKIIKINTAKEAMDIIIEG